MHVDPASDAAYEPAEFKHEASVVPELHAVLPPHLHAELVQILLKVAPHSAFEPHLQVPASQVSEVPEQVTTLHGSKTEKKPTNRKLNLVNVFHLNPINKRISKTV